jgi:NAD(P)H-flavin reductase
MKPHVATLIGVRNLATGIKLFQVSLDDVEAMQSFDYQPGQFAEVSAFGVGESPFGITSTPARSEAIEFAVNRVGTVTDALHRLDTGDKIGLRGPLGNSFPMQQFRGQNVVVLGGGIGGAPLRPVIQTILDNRSDYGKLSIFWAARSPDLLVFTDEYDEWQAAPDTELHLTVDQATPDWPHMEGLITTLVEKVQPSADNAISITCGPPIMIKFAMMTLSKLGFSSQQNWVTLEAKMKCGIGKCGRCNMGEKFVCLDGPVFRFDQVEQFLESFV